MKTVFSTSGEALQYLADVTGKRVAVVDKKAGQELFTAVVERDHDTEHIKDIIKRLGTADVTDSQDMTPLFAAVENDDYQMVELLLSLGANVNKQSKFVQKTVLMHAAEFSTPEMVRLLVKRGAKVNQQNIHDETVLTRVVSNNDPLDVESSDSFEMIKLLLSLGADPNTGGDAFFARPMSVAIMNDNFYVFKELVKHGGKVTWVERERKNWQSFSDLLRKRDPRFYVRLKVASVLVAEYNKQHEVDYVEFLTGARKNDLNRVKKVLERGNVDVNLIERTTHQNALFMATDPEVMRYLLEKGADPNLVDIDTRTPLFFQTHHGSPETIELLVKYGADVNYRDTIDMTPLMYMMFVSGVSSETFLKKTKKLLDLGADVDGVDRSFGQNVLFFSVYFNAPVEVVTLLLKHGAEVSARTRDLDEWKVIRQKINPRVMVRVKEGAVKKRPERVEKEPTADDLTRAVAKRDREKVKEILKTVDVNERDSSGFTALIEAVNTQDNETVKFVLFLGADPNVGTNSGWTPLFYAITDNKLDIIKTLVDAGTDVNYLTPLNISPLYLAVRDEKKEAALFLLKRGANPNRATTSKYRTIVSQAIEHNDPELVVALVEHGAKITREDKLAVNWYHVKEAITRDRRFKRFWTRVDTDMILGDD